MGSGVALTGNDTAGDRAISRQDIHRSAGMQHLGFELGTQVNALDVATTVVATQVHEGPQGIARTAAPTALLHLFGHEQRAHRMGVRGPHHFIDPTRTAMRCHRLLEFGLHLRVEIVRRHEARILQGILQGAAVGGRHRRRQGVEDAVPHPRRQRVA